MTATELLTNLQARGVIVKAAGDRLKLDAPVGALTDEALAELRAHKAEILAALTADHGCPNCGGALRLQDRQADAWFCPGCRKWCNGEGGQIAEIETPRPLTLEEAEARQLVADLLAAGCGFVTDDGEHIRVTNINRISTALWLRFNEATPEFKRLALEAAQTHEAEAAPEWLM